jgi:beta-galactosidase
LIIASPHPSPQARRIFGDLARAAGLETRDLPDGLRCRDTATETFWFNYDSQPHQIDGVTVPAAGFVRLVR